MTKKMKNDKNFNFLLAMIFPLISLVLSACLGVPSGISPVEDFELKRYLGTWYEIARLDHPFERGLQKVTAEYSLRDDGGLRVVRVCRRILRHDFTYTFSPTPPRSLLTLQLRSF